MPPRSDIHARLVSGKARIIVSGKWFFNYVRCDVYDVHSTRKRHRRSYIRLSPARLTIATVYLRELPKSGQINSKSVKVMSYNVAEYVVGWLFMA